MPPECSNNLLFLLKRYILPVLYGLLLAGFFLLFKKWGLISLILALAAFYGLFIFLAVAGQKILIFCPVREIQSTPGDLQLPYEPVRLNTPDGETLHAWFVPGDQNQPVVLFCHGNNSNISSLCHLKLLELLHSQGLSTIIFNYRGFGRSSGSPYQAGTYRDGEAVWEYLVQSRGYSGRDIIIWGKSLGGGIAGSASWSYHLPEDEP